MSFTHTIQHLTRNEIDSIKWNNCVERSANGLIYAFSYYLDALCDNWDAFVIDDYNAILPLPWRKKAGIKYIYAPPFIQQLGIIGTHEATSYTKLLKRIKEEFRYGDIFFNYSQTQLQIPVVEKINFVLPLHKSYEELAAGFTNDLKKNLKAANPQGFFLSIDYPHKEVIKIFKENYQHRMPHVNNGYERFSTLCDRLKQENKLFTRTIRNSENKVLATALFLIDGKRIYNLMNTTTTEGRKLKANHFLLNEVLKEFSNSNLLFDFEGSDLPGVKEFYQNYGPVNQPYFHWHFNFLPFPLNLLRK
jgi:hypothetical protein